MSNLGLELALKAEGLEFVRAQVGDRYVNRTHGGRRLVSRRGVLGPYYLLRRHHHRRRHCRRPAGIGALKESGLDLATFRSGMKSIPAQMINVPWRARWISGHFPPCRRRGPGEAQLGQRGRVLLRPPAPSRRFG